MFLGMRMQIGHKYDIDWDAFVHAIISGIGSAICIYLNSNAALAMNGITGMYLYMDVYSMYVCMCFKN